MLIEPLEIRVLLSTAFDITGLTAMRQNPSYSSITGKGVAVADLDTGVYAQNPDLKNNIVAFYNAVEQPLNSPVDPNFLQDAVDNNGHGTHTSGIEASSNPSIGVAYGASLVDVKVLPDPGEVGIGGDALDRGLQWVALHANQFNIKVVNMSLGFGDNLNFTPALDQYGADIQQLQSMGITVVSASGNSYAQYAAPGAAIPAVESTINVGNSFSDNGVGQYDFSGYYGGSGDTWYARQLSAAPDIFNATSQRSTLFNQVVAPGTDILSTWNSPSQLYNTDSGTSMASPFVSGTVALMQQAAFQASGKYLQPTQVLQILRDTSDTIQDPVNQPAVRAAVQFDGTLGPDQPLPGTGYNFDRVNVYRAIQETQQFVQGATPGSGDLNNTIATSTPTQPLNGASSINVFGNVGVDGLQVGGSRVGVNDIDVYRVSLQVTGALNIQLSPISGGVNFTPTLRLFDSTGAQLYIATNPGAGYPSIATSSGRPLAVGTYYVGVSSSSNNAYDITNATGIGGGTSQGDYQLQITVNNPDPTGVPAAGTPLNLNSPTTTATFGSSNLPANIISDVIGQQTDQSGVTYQIPNGDVRFFQVVAPDDGVLDVSADNGCIVGAFDSSYNLIGSEGSEITVPVSIGQTYYLGVTTSANAGFDPTDPYTRAAGSTTPPTPFDLTVSFNNGDVDGTLVQAYPTAIGAPITSQIGGTEPGGSGLEGASGGYKDADFYAFTAPSSGVFHATVSGVGGFSPAMSLWSSNNGITGVQRLADAATTGTMQLYQQVTAGQIVVVSVTGLGNQNLNGISLGSGAGGQTGTYSLTTALDPSSELTTLSNNSIQNATPTPLALNTPITGNIGKDGSLVVGPNDVDIYSFVAPSTREYQFATDTTLETSAKTVLRVFDSQGDQIAVNQASSAVSTNSVAQVPLSAGETVYVGISGVGPQAFTYNPLTGANTGPATSTGPYTLTATDVGAFQRTLPLVQGQPAKYTDANGHRITVTLNGPGSGQLLFQSTTDGANVSQIQLNGTDATSTLTVRGATTLGGLTDVGSMGTINARQDDLAGDLSVTASLGNLFLATASGGHSITVGTGSKLNLNVGTLTDESLVSAEPVNTIRAGQWTVSSSTRQQISAPSIQNLNVRGAFNEDVNVSGTVGHFNVGSLSSSAIRVQSAIASISAGSAADIEIFVNVTNSLTTLPAAPTDFGGGGSIGNVRVRGAFSDTQIAAWDIGSVTLNNVQTANNGKPFGVATNSISHLRAVPAGGKPVLVSHAFAPQTAISLGGDALVRLLG